MDCCRWAGVYCDEAGHVAGLFLNKDNISGKVYLDVFGKFKYLQDLDLADNNVTVIPNTNGSSFSSLANLNRLMLASCKMNEIPDLRNLPALRTLDLSGNRLKGPFRSF
nr:hypothetical protein [Tanacetum cinerariifolium]